MNFRVAIDFGTSRTKAAYYNPKMQQPKPELVRLGHGSGGEKSMPSLFHCTKNGEIHVGNNAQDALLQEGESGIIPRIKLNMSASWRPWGQRLDSEALLVCLFTEIRTIIERTVPPFNKGQRPPMSVTLTTTGIYKLSDREILLAAAEKAGFKPPMELLPEPEGAARVWLASLDTAAGSDERRDVVVVDCGGGTVDWAYMHKTLSGRFRLVPTLPPESHLIGGERVDEALQTRVLADHKPVEDMERLRQDCRARKEAYCLNMPVDSVSVGKERVPLEGGDIQAVIDEEFIQPTCDKIAPYLKRVKETTRREVPLLLLVGGSSRLKGLKAALEERFGCEVYQWGLADFTEFAPVLGAALPLPHEQSQNNAHIDVTYDRAVGFMANEEYEKAVSEFTAALEFAPERVDLLASIAAAHLACGSLGDAARDARKALTLKPNCEQAQKVLEGIVKIHCTLGVEALVNNKYEDALSDFNEALKIEPNHEKVLEDIVQILYTLDDEVRAKAEKTVQKVFQRNPSSGSAESLMHRIASQEFSFQSATAEPAASHQSIADADSQSATAEPAASHQSIADAEEYIATGGNAPRREAAPKSHKTSGGNAPRREAAPKSHETSTKSWNAWDPWAVWFLLGCAAYSGFIGISDYQGSVFEYAIFQACSFVFALRGTNVLLLLGMGSVASFSLSVGLDGGFHPAVILMSCVGLAFGASIRAGFRSDRD